MLYNLIEPKTISLRLKGSLILYITHVKLIAHCASAIWLQAMSTPIHLVPPPPPPLGTPAQYSLPSPVRHFAYLHSVQEGRRDRGDVVRGGNKQDLRTGREWYDPLNRALSRTTTPQPSHQIRGGENVCPNGLGSSQRGEGLKWRTALSIEGTQTGEPHHLACIPYLLAKGRTEYSGNWRQTLRTKGTSPQAGHNICVLNRVQVLSRQVNPPTSPSPLPSLPPSRCCPSGPGPPKPDQTNRRLLKFFIQQTAWVYTKKNQGRSSRFQLCDAGVLVENPSHIRTPTGRKVST